VTVLQIFSRDSTSNDDSESNLETVDNSGGIAGKKFLRRQCSCRLLSDNETVSNFTTESNFTTPTFSEACGGFDILEMPCFTNSSELPTNLTNPMKPVKKPDEWKITTWPEDTKNRTFSCSSLTWYQLFNKENPTDWEALAAEYITVKLNIMDGCQHSESLTNDLESAKNLLDVCTWTREDTLTAQDLKTRLHDYNHGKSTTLRLGASNQASTQISLTTEGVPTDSSFLLILIPTIISVTILVLVTALIFIKQRPGLDTNTTGSPSQAPTDSETRIVFDS